MRPRNQDEQLIELSKQVTELQLQYEPRDAEAGTSTAANAGRLPTTTTTTWWRDARVHRSYWANLWSAYRTSMARWPLILARPLILPQSKIVQPQTTTPLLTTQSPKAGSRSGIAGANVLVRLIVVRGSALRIGKTKSCGCLIGIVARTQKHRLLPLVGRKLVD